MARYHFNRETGKTGLCSAKIQCRLGLTEAEHFATEAEARQAFEGTQGGSFGGEAASAKKGAAAPALQGLTLQEAAAVEKEVDTYAALRNQEDALRYQAQRLRSSLSFAPEEERASLRRQIGANQQRLGVLENRSKALLEGLEDRGLGHLVPDHENTLRVRNKEQKRLMENELKGQFSDGMWENSYGENWKAWNDATVIVDPHHVGRNFTQGHGGRRLHDGYNITSKDLLSEVGGRMVEEVRRDTGKDYDEKTMMKDLRDLKRIMKTPRSEHSLAVAHESIQQEVRAGASSTPTSSRKRATPPAASPRRREAPAASSGKKQPPASRKAPSSASAPRPAPARDVTPKAPRGQRARQAAVAGKTVRIPSSVGTASSPAQVLATGLGRGGTPAPLRGKRVGHANPVSGEGLNGRASGHVYILAKADGSRARIYKGQISTTPPEDQLGRPVDLAKVMGNGSTVSRNDLFVLGTVDASGRASGWVPDRKLNYFQE